MREVFADIEKWRREKKSVAIATNVKRIGMSLRPLAAKMAVTPYMEISGSVTGGCLEGAVYEEAQGVIKSKLPKLLHYGVSGEQKPWDIGLTCGSSLDIFVESLDSPAWQMIYPEVKWCIEENKLAAVATVISGSVTGKKLLLRGDGKIFGDLGGEELNSEVLTWMKLKIADQEADWQEFNYQSNKIEVFVDIILPEAKLIIIGAGHIAIPLVAMAKIMGFHTIILDPREAFATDERFPNVDELIKDWPAKALDKISLDENTYVVAISHDEKLDNPALAKVLKSSVRYVGVLGTRKNIGLRLKELKELGVSVEQLRKLRAPIGVSLGAVTPEEIAVSILAEMVEARHGLLKPEIS